jgi:uncharacterized cupredoxin-like copper-binding protein
VRVPGCLKLRLRKADAPDVKPLTPPRVARIGFVAIALVAVACSSSSQDRATPPGDQAVRLKVADFAIKAPKRIAAGTIVFDVRNAGPDTHELILVRADGSELPFRPDNLTIDEDALESRTVSVLEDDHPGTLRLWNVRLAPGRYELLCNMSGHYLGGMSTELIVR